MKTYAPRQVRFRQIQKKHSLDGPTPSGGTKRKRKVVAEDLTAVDDEGNLVKGPSNKAPARKRASGKGKRATKKKKTAAAAKEQGSEGHEGFGQGDSSVKKEANINAPSIEPFNANAIQAETFNPNAGEVDLDNGAQYAAAAAALQLPPQMPASPVAHDQVHAQHPQMYAGMMQSTSNHNGFGAFQQIAPYNQSSQSMDFSNWRHPQEQAICHDEEFRQMQMRSQLLQQQHQQNEFYQAPVYDQGHHHQQHQQLQFGDCSFAYHPSFNMGVALMEGGAFGQSADHTSSYTPLSPEAQKKQDDALFAEFINMPSDVDDDTADAAAAVESPDLNVNMPDDEGEVEFLLEQAAKLKEEEDSTI